MARLEHVNFTVSDPDATARMCADLFGWHVRWKGAAKAGGYTVHVGGEHDYVAVYRPAGDTAKAPESYGIVGGLNHVGVVVDDLDATEAAVLKAGFTPHSHADYEPGRRFYFHDGDGIEWEVVSYT